MDDEHRVHLEKQYWEACAADPDVDVKYIADVDAGECVDLIDKNLRFPIGASVLDLGCGVGRICIPLAERTPEIHVTGLDISHRMLQLAESRSMLVKNLSYLQGDGRTIPFPDKTVNAVYSMLLFQHLDPAGMGAYLDEIARVLVAAGTFFFQWIEGNEQEPFSWHYPRDVMSDALLGRGLHIEGVQTGLIHEQWSWATAVKLNG